MKFIDTRIEQQSKTPSQVLIPPNCRKIKFPAERSWAELNWPAENRQMAENPGNALQRAEESRVERERERGRNARAFFSPLSRAPCQQLLPPRRRCSWVSSLSRRIAKSRKSHSMQILGELRIFDWAHVHILSEWYTVLVGYILRLSHMALLICSSWKYNVLSLSFTEKIGYSDTTQQTVYRLLCHFSKFPIDLLDTVTQ